MEESIGWVTKWIWLFLTDEIKNAINGVFVNALTEFTCLDISEFFADISKKNEAAVVQNAGKHIAFAVIWKRWFLWGIVVPLILKFMKE